jgi:prevent-host-death family protein
MNTKNVLSISRARAMIFEIAKEVQKPSQYFTLTENGQPKVVMMSAEEFDSIMETMDILSDPNILNDIKKAEEEFKKGEYLTLEEFKKQQAN